MTRMRFGFLVLVIAASACASRRTATTAGEIVVTVVSSANTSMYLPGIEVSFIARDGSLHAVGQTDRDGMIRIPKATLRTADASVVLFCHRNFFCGALLAKEKDLLSYDEYLVALSPVTVR